MRHILCGTYSTCTTVLKILLFPIDRENCYHQFNGVSSGLKSPIYKVLLFYTEHDTN